MRTLLLPLLALAGPSAAAERTYSVSSFDRVRVEAPVQVQLTVGASPAGRATGERDALDRLDLTVQGSTLMVRLRRDGWGEQARQGAPAPSVTIATPALRGAILLGSGKLAVAGRFRAQRIDLQLSGSGSLGVQGIEADQLGVILLGSGSVSIAGRAGQARFVSSGSGSVDAGALAVRDLVVEQEGTGEASASADKTARVTATGLGRVVVRGSASCVVRQLGGGVALCGKDAPPAAP